MSTHNPSIGHNQPPIDREWFEPFEADLADLVSRIGSAEYNVDDPEHVQLAREHNSVLANTIKALDAAHAELKRPILDAANALDSNRKRIKDALLKLKARTQAAVDAQKKRAAEESAEIDRRIAAIYDLAQFTGRVDSDWAAGQLGKLNAIDATDPSWRNRKGDAALAIFETGQTLRDKHAELLAEEMANTEREANRLLAENKARAEREDKLKLEAAANAKRNAEIAAANEIAEANRKAREEKERAEREFDARKRAEHQAKIAKEKAVADERARIERERLAEESKRDAERKAIEFAKADESHREKIHQEAAAELFELGIFSLDAKGDDYAWAVINAIVAGKIPHIKIEY